MHESPTADSPLPRMADLDRLEAALNNVDRALADLELNAPAVPTGEVGPQTAPVPPTPWR